MEIRLELVKKDIIDAAKNETYLSGRAMLDGTNAEAVYHRQAGGESSHEAKLYQGFLEAVNSAKVSFAPYVQSVEGEEDDTTYVVSLTLSDRYNATMLGTLAGVLASYVTSYVVGLWWVAVSPELAKNYLDQSTIQLERMKQCFVKDAPKKPHYKYPTKLTLEEGLQEGFAQLRVGDELYIGYTISGEVENVKNDIVVESCCPQIVKAEQRDGEWYVTKLSDSKACCVVYSRHNPDVCVRLG